MPRIIRVLLLFQIFLWFFYLGVGLEQWRSIWYYEPQTALLFFLPLMTLLIYERFQSLSLSDRTFSIFFQNALLLGVITWFFSRDWGNFWEVVLIVYSTCVIILLLFSSIFEEQLSKIVPPNLWIPQNLWRFWSILTIINIFFTSFLTVILGENLSTIWIFYGLFWFFLWKTEF